MGTGLWREWAFQCHTLLYATSLTEERESDGEALSVPEVGKPRAAGDTSRSDRHDQGHQEKLWQQVTEEHTRPGPLQVRQLHTGNGNLKQDSMYMTVTHPDLQSLVTVPVKFARGAWCTSQITSQLPKAHCFPQISNLYKRQTNLFILILNYLFHAVVNRWVIRHDPIGKKNLHKFICLLEDFGKHCPFSSWLVVCDLSCQWQEVEKVGKTRSLQTFFAQYLWS